tara:strand:+ start:5565 stop:6143 length:579 start_codon:yes stop_codon:yes gene_type:complete
MRITIHQPEHLPYMGFFQKVSAADLLVILDNVKFRKNYFQNRNKIKNLNGDDEWITVPVEKKATSKKIKDVKVSEDPNWRGKLQRKIAENFKFDASYFYDSDRLLSINMRGIIWAMGELNIRTPIIHASEVDCEGNKSELLAGIVKELGGTSYISGPSGKDYLDMSFFDGIDVTFFEPKVENYYSCLYNILR